MHEKDHKHDIAPWRHKLHEVIFEADTPTGKWFDIILIISIILSVVVVMLDSIQVVKIENAELLFAAEWFFTILFTIEYILRLLSVSRPLHYAKSFFGIIELILLILIGFIFLVLNTCRY